MTGLEIVPLMPDHADFVVGTFGASIRAQLPWSMTDVRGHMDVLERAVRDPDTTALVAVPKGHPEDFLGWAVSHAGCLVYAYVRYVVRKQGIGGALIEALKLEAPTPVVYWTRACSRMAAAGKPLFFDVPALETLTGLVH